MDKANAHLKKPRDTITHADLIKAYTIFDSVLSAKRSQNPPATPKELAHINDKLRSTCLRLSHFLNVTPTQRMKYIDSAAKFAKRALENAIASRNNDRVVQMQFYLTCVQAREIQLRMTDAQFQDPTPSEKDAAKEAVSVAWATLRSIENLDMSLYDTMAMESISHLG
jgi:hypothetical protein